MGAEVLLKVTLLLDIRNYCWFGADLWLIDAHSCLFSAVN